MSLVVVVSFRRSVSCCDFASVWHAFSALTGTVGGVSCFCLLLATRPAGYFRREVTERTEQSVMVRPEARSPSAGTWIQSSWPELRPLPDLRNICSSIRNLLRFHPKHTFYKPKFSTLCLRPGWIESRFHQNDQVLKNC